jgi:hypothetical protein
MNLASPKGEALDGCVPQFFQHNSIAHTPPQLADEPKLEEPTSTLVLTSSRGEFVDIRIFCKPGETLPNDGESYISYSLSFTHRLTPL